MANILKSQLDAVDTRVEVMLRKLFESRATNIEDLSGVDIQNPDDDDVLFYNLTLDLWQNYPLKTINGTSLKGPGDISVSGLGTVTSVGFTAPGQFSVSGSPVTGSGTIALSWSNQNAHRVLAGPSTGSPAAPTFRALVANDIPGLPASQIRNLQEQRLMGWGSTIDSEGSAQVLTLGTGFVWGVGTLDLTTNLQGWSGVATTAKQDTLVSGTSIKTINGTSVLGSGDIVISGGSGDAFISQQQRWGAVVVAASSLRGVGCFEQMAGGGNAWLGASGTNPRTTHILYTLSWARTQSSAALNNQVTHFSGTLGDAEFGSRFARKNTVNSSYEGFFAKVRFAITGPDFGSPSTIKSDYRLIAGLVSTTSISATADPSAQLNCIFIGKDSADSNLQLMHNDGSGTCTKVDLGAGLSATGVDRIPFEFRVTAPRGGTTMTWSLIRLDTFAVSASGTVSTDLIADNARVFPGILLNTGPNTSTLVEAYCGGTYMVSDFQVPS